MKRPYKPHRPQKPKKPNKEDYYQLRDRIQSFDFPCNKPCSKETKEALIKLLSTEDPIVITTDNNNYTGDSRVNIHEAILNLEMYNLYYERYEKDLERYKSKLVLHEEKLNQFKKAKSEYDLFSKIRRKKQLEKELETINENLYE